MEVLFRGLAESARLEGGSMRLNKEPALLPALILEFVDRSADPEQRSRVGI